MRGQPATSAASRTMFSQRGELSKSYCIASRFAKTRSRRMLLTPLIHLTFFWVQLFGFSTFPGFCNGFVCWPLVVDLDAAWYLQYCVLVLMNCLTGYMLTSVRSIPQPSRRGHPATKSRNAAQPNPLRVQHVRAPSVFVAG